jgi:hypothetical protein
MKKIFLFFFLILIFFFVALPLVAQEENCQPACPPDKFCLPNPLKYCSFEELISKIVDFLWYLALVLFPIAVVVAGFYFITALGDPTKITTAKKIVLYALIGLLIIGSSKGLIALIKKIFEE